VPIFLERFLLVVCATAFYGIVFANAMQIDIHYRIGIGITLVGFAYILGHAVHTSNSVARSKEAPSNPNNNKVPEAIQKIDTEQQRVFLPPDVDVAYLRSLCEGKTQLQADAATAIYLGKWTTVSGRVRDVEKFPDGFRVRIRTEASDPVSVAILFSERWADQISILKRGSLVHAIGRVKDVYEGGVALSEGEIGSKD